ncbi:hypothetical protein [Flavobacterium sp. JAS]|uniref:hypothetical protein n=1 Tax=Flavobacterium sp. JAS TaxID=2897329 RepID=UPI001E2DBF3D|nr:hypothetical protein [Flavobacterium sp. JAS]MCD0470914.1 hypothetical protein [Flavobacterium sp. JAS]
MNKIWIYNDDGSFSLYHNDMEIGTLNRGDDWAKQLTTFNIYSENYKIKTRFGIFRKNRNCILNEQGETIIDIELGFNQKFKCQNRHLLLTFTDKPFWKWAIMEGNKVLTSYEINLSDPQIGPNIECSDEEYNNYIFDFILGNLVLGKTAQDFY